MSSVTSTKVLPADAASRPGRHRTRSGRPGKQQPERSAAESRHADSERDAKDDGFRVSHFFVLLSLLGATVAVVMARPAAPENLVLISLTIGAAGLAATAFYLTIAPLVAPHWEEGREPLSARLRADLEREKALTLRSFKELEFDRAMGKVSEADFAQMAARLRARALGIMKQLDASDLVYRQQIEHELAARLGKGGTAAPPATAEPVANVPPCTCGTLNDVDARFCKSCGANLAETRA